MSAQAHGALAGRGHLPRLRDFHPERMLVNVGHEIHVKRPRPSPRINAPDVLADARRSTDHDTPSASLPKQHLHQTLGKRQVQSRGLRALVQALRPVNGKRLVPALEADHQRYPAPRAIYELAKIAIKDDRGREGSM